MLLRDFFFQTGLQFVNHIKLFAKWSRDISRDLLTQCLYFKLLRTMSSLRQILIQFHNLCDYTGQSQNLSQFLFGSGRGSCGGTVDYLRKYMKIIEKYLD